MRFASASTCGGNNIIVFIVQVSNTEHVIFVLRQVKKSVRRACALHIIFIQCFIVVCRSIAFPSRSGGLHVRCEYDFKSSICIILHVH